MRIHLTTEEVGEAVAYFLQENMAMTVNPKSIKLLSQNIGERYEDDRLLPDGISIEVGPEPAAPVPTKGSEPK